uniref:Reverse transcriptase domain-containing protein n=1 Tax=Tanacetum cinerariifolium TaxID=118510 RepID=A0A6L2NH76_TANCI|nr:reverse transcriptase domain-containing protein [Tanacetum cinerariifolium]
MADLHFNNDHNKVAYLLKPKESQSFHPIIDFMNALYIMYALTANPTINASLVRQFWGSASKVSLPDGMKGLVATIDGTSYTITEAFIRSALHRTKFLMYPRFLQIILDTETEDTTPYPAPLVTKKIFANMRHYQGPDMPLLAHMLNQGEPALVQAQPQEVSPPPPSPVVEPHPSTDPMPSPPRQSSPSPIPFGPAPSSGVASIDPIPEIPSSSRPTKPVLEKMMTLVVALFLGDHLRIATLEAELKATKILHRDEVVLFAKRIKKLESKLKTKKRKLQSSFGLDFADAAIPAAGWVSVGGTDPAVVTSAGGADPADVVVSAGDVDSAGTFISAGVSVTAGPSVASAPSSPIRDPAKGKEIATPFSPRVAEEQEKEIRASAEQSTPRQAELDRFALNLTNEEWIGLVDQVWANPTLSAKLLGADVSKDTFSVRMVELMNQRRKAIAKIKAKAKRDKPPTPAQQKEYMRAFVKNQSTAVYTTGAVDLATAKDHHQQLKRSGETLESSESKKLKRSHNTEQLAELSDTTSVSAGATIAAGDPIYVVPSVPAVPSISAASSIPAETPIAAGVSTTAGVSESASVPIIDLLDSPPKATSLPLDPTIAEQAVPLRKSSKKKSMARRRNLPRPSQLESAALPFDEDDPEAEFKKYLRPVSDDDEPVEPVSLSLYKLERATGIGLGLWSDLRTLITAREDRDASIIWDDQDQWEIRSWRFYALPGIHGRIVGIKSLLDAVGINAPQVYVNTTLMNMHAGTRSVMAIALRIGYYWPTMHKDARSLIKGIDIAGPFPEGPGKVKFLIIAIDYFTKWIEAKPVATITSNQIKKFMWDNIVCRFGLPGEIILDNGKQLWDNPFKDWCEKLSEIDMPTLRSAEVDLVENDEALGINLDLLEEKREQASIREAKMEKYYNSKVRVQVLNRETLCTVTTMQAVRKTYRSWAPNGKECTKLQKHLERAHIS